MNFIKKSVQLLIVLLIILTAYLSGIYVSEYKQRQKANECTVTTIAVVNADTGITINGKSVNYAEELIVYPDVNFVNAGLLDAREGIVSNKYAAYILIPSTFSNSVNSINQKPEKAQITYEINPNLREDVQIKVSDDIYNFLVCLDTNISYVYVDSILREVHSVQDDSNAIMLNDISDMEFIKSINSADLIQDVEYTELEKGKVEIKYLDLYDDFESVQNTSDNICLTIETDMQSAEDDFVAILESTDTIDTALLGAEDTIQNVDILTNSDGVAVYQNGIELLAEYTEQIVEDTSIRKKAAKEILGWEETESEQKTSIEELNELIDEQIILLETFLLQDAGQTVLLNSTETVSGNDVASMNIEIEEVDIQQIVSNLETLKLNLDTYYDNGINAIDAIPEASWVTEDMQTIIDEKISQPILEECNTEKQAVTDAMSNLQSAVDSYTATVDAYDVNSYIERDKIATDLSYLQQVIADMQEEIVVTDNSYIQYINELDVLTNQNIKALQDSLDLSYQLTRSNIDTAISGLKANREELNEQNVQMLGDIVQKLSYTRLGNLEYTQAYDFIVQPTTRENISDKKEILAPADQGVNALILVLLVIGISVLSGLYWSIPLIQKGIQNYNGKEEEV